jgi:hypothetical protein
MRQLLGISIARGVVMLCWLILCYGCTNTSTFDEQKDIVHKLISAMHRNDSSEFKHLMFAESYMKDCINYDFNFEKGHFQLTKTANKEFKFEVMQHEKDEYLLCEIKTELNRGSILLVQFVKLAPSKIFSFSVTGEGSPEQWKM